jgi:hypothetical protein
VLNITGGNSKQLKTVKFILWISQLVQERSQELIPLAKEDRLLSVLVVAAVAVVMVVLEIWTAIERQKQTIDELGILMVAMLEN